MHRTSSVPCLSIKRFGKNPSLQCWLEVVIPFALTNGHNVFVLSSARLAPTESLGKSPAGERSKDGIIHRRHVACEPCKPHHPRIHSPASHINLLDGDIIVREKDQFLQAHGV